MRSLKRHLSLIIPLLAILFSIQSVLTILRIQDSYERTLKSSYSIIIASNRELSNDEVILRVPEFGAMQPIDAQSIVQKLQGEVSEENLQRLKGSLPYYYSLTLSSFPSQTRLAQIASAIGEIKDVRRVESFSKAHDRIYRLLVILKSVIVLFALTVGLVGILLMVKQIEVWYFEHSERIEIMMLLGAPSWLRNGILFRLAVVDSIIAAFVISLVSLYTSAQGTILGLLQEMSITSGIFSPEIDFIILLVSALVLSNLSVFVVIKKIAKGNSSG